MIRPLARLPLRSVTPRNLLRTGQRPQRRGISFFAPPSTRPRSLRNKLTRLGIAGGAIYWYANSDLNLFDREANELGYVGTEFYDTPQEIKLPTLESIAESRRQRHTATAAAPASAPEPQSHRDVVTAPSSQQSLSRDVASSASAHSPASATSGTPPIAPSSDHSQSSPEALEEEASSEGAFNEETGEINWDCPCLGGMAHGPCGPEFREAFSCFVYSKEEPKGVDCIDRFKGMQDCFREHPDVYGAELTDELDEETEEALDAANAPQAGAAPPADAPYSGAKTPSANTPDHNLTANPPSTPSSSSGTPSGNSGTKVKNVAKPSGERPEESQRTNRAKQATKQVEQDHGSENPVKDHEESKQPEGSQMSYKKEQDRSESDSIIPKAALDTTSMNDKYTEK